MCEVLKGSLTEAGIGAVLGVLLSYVVEWYPKWDTLAARVKRLVLLGLCLLIAVAMLLLNWQLCGAALDADTVWQALSAGLAAFAAGQVAHLRKL